MNKTNKIIVSLAIAVFAVLSVFVSLVAVFAEENEIIRNVNAACKVYNADCHVSASFAYGDKATEIYTDAKDFTISGLEDGDKFLTFDKTDATKNMFQEKMLKPTNDIVLTKENSSVIFKFDIANFDFDACDVTIVLDNKQNENLEIEYSKDGVVWSGKNVKFKVDGTEGMSSKETSYFVKISLKDKNQEVEFNTDFSLTIHNKF